MFRPFRFPYAALMLLSSCHLSQSRVETSAINSFFCFLTVVSDKFSTWIQWCSTFSLRYRIACPLEVACHRQPSYSNWRVSASPSTCQTYHTTDSIEGASLLANCHYIAEITRPKGVLTYSRHAILRSDHKYAALWPFHIYNARQFFSHTSLDSGVDHFYTLFCLPWSNTSFVEWPLSLALLLNPTRIKYHFQKLVIKFRLPISWQQYDVVFSDDKRIVL